MKLSKFSNSDNNKIFRGSLGDNKSIGFNGINRKSLFSFKNNSPRKSNVYNRKHSDINIQNEVSLIFI